MSSGVFCQTDKSTLTAYMQSSVSSARKTMIKNMLGAQFRRRT